MSLILAENAKKVDNFKALENYDLATSWMETDGEKEVVRK